MTRQIKDFFVNNTKDSEAHKELKDLLGKKFDVISVKFVNKHVDKDGNVSKDLVFVVDQYTDETCKDFLFIHEFHVKWYKNPTGKKIRMKDLKK